MTRKQTLSDEPASVVVRGSEKAEYWFREGCYITEWLNESSNPDMSIARARVKPGETTQWHKLTGVTERYLVISGEGEVEVGLHPPTPMRAGDSVCIGAGIAQRIVNRGNVDLVFLAICTPRFDNASYQSL